jgi:hypothetical protein
MVLFSPLYASMHQKSLDIKPPYFLSDPFVFGGPQKTLFKIVSRKQIYCSIFYVLVLSHKKIPKNTILYFTLYTKYHLYMGFIVKNPSKQCGSLKNNMEEKQIKFNVKKLHF